MEQVGSHKQIESRDMSGPDRHVPCHFMDRHQQSGGPPMTFVAPGFIDGKKPETDN
jgi:hypothetical protein